ncbi:MAG: 2-hydroxyacid dehydrogenase, partial [Litoreibacter sp.]|nr:2-hydroxyacid dehydrogenase [Litoreibacter sp.]
MTRHDVLVMAPPRPKAMAQLEATYRLQRFDLAEDKDAFLEEVGARCKAVVTNGHTVLNCDQIGQLPNVGIVACSSAGFETIDAEALRERGIALTNSSDALSDDVA